MSDSANVVRATQADFKPNHDMKSAVVGWWTSVETDVSGNMGSMIPVNTEKADALSKQITQNNLLGTFWFLNSFEDMLGRIWKYGRK